MFNSFIHWFPDRPKVTVIGSIILLALCVVLIQEGLFIDGKLNIDTSAKPFSQEKPEEEQDIVIGDRFKGANDKKIKAREDTADGRKWGRHNYTIVLKPKNLEQFNLDFFLKLEEITDSFSSEPSVYSVQSLMDASRSSGFCIGKAIIKIPSVGNICESVLETYHSQMACIQNREENLKNLAALETIEDDLNFGYDDENDDLFDIEDEEEGTPVSSTVGEIGGEIGGANNFVCSRSILEKTEKDIYQDTEAKISQVFKDIQISTMLHKRVIAGDLKATVIGVRLIAGENMNEEKSLAMTEKHLNKMRSWGWDVAWMSPKRLKSVIVETIMHDLKTLLPITIFLMLGSLYLSFRSVSGMLLPFVVVAVALALTIAIIALTGIPLNTVTVAIPALLICVGNDYAIIFLTKYYQEIRARQNESKVAVVKDVLQHLITPLSVTALTTVCGFSALMISEIPAIQQLGFFASVGVVLSIFLSLTFLPSLLIILPRPKVVEKKNGAGQASKSFMESYLDKLTHLVEKYPVKIMWFWALLTLVFMIGVSMVRVDGDMNPISEDNPMMKDRAFFIDNFIGDDRLDIYVESKDQNFDLQSVELMYGLRDIKSWLFQKEGANDLSKIRGLRVDRMDSSLDYLSVNRNGLDNLKDKEVRFYFKNTAPKYNFPKHLSNDKDLYRFKIYFTADNIPAKLELVEALKQQLRLKLPRTNYYIKGHTILVSEAQNNLSRGQIESIVLALVFVFIILSALFMSFKMGALAVVPNIIPVTIFFGTLGFTSTPIGFTISLVAAIVLGIGVDDTIHYLTHYHANLKKLRNEKQAALLTIKQTGRPMTYTTISLGLGFVVFLFSDMYQQRLFGVMTAYIFVVCLITDMNFLPSVMSKVKFITAWDYLSMKIDMAFVHSLALFDGMTEREVKLATLSAYTIDLEADEFLFHEKDFANEAYVVLKGNVELYFDEKYHGERRSFGHRGLGEVIGIRGLFRRAERKGTAVATESSQLLVLNEDILFNLQKKYPLTAMKLFMNFAKTLAMPIASANQQVASKRIQALLTFENDPKAYQEYLEKMIDDIIEDGVMSPSERQEFEKIIYADGIVSPEEQVQLDRLNQMLESNELKEEQSIEDLIDKIIEDGVIDPEERAELNKVVYADHFISPEEQVQLDRLETLIQEGKVVEYKKVFENILQKMTASQVKWFNKQFEVKKVAANEVLFSQGDHGDYMIVVNKGSLNVKAKGTDGRESIIATRIAGDLVGAVDVIIGDNIRNVTVEALEASEVVLLSLKELKRMESKNKKLAAQFYFNLVCMFSDHLEESLRELDHDLSSAQ